MAAKRWFPILRAQEASIGPAGVVPLPGYQGPAIAAPSPAALTAGSDLNRATKPGVQWITGGDSLSSGSQLNRAQIGAPWPSLIDGGFKYFPAWIRNAFHDWFKVSIPANYGGQSSRANFGFNDPEYEPGELVRNSARRGNMLVDAGPVVGLYPGPVPNARRPMYNVLAPISWRNLVVNENQIAAFGQPASQEGILTVPMEFTPTGTGSLSTTGTPPL